MRFTKLIIILISASIIQFGNLQAYGLEEFNVLKDKFYKIEEIVKDDSLDKVRYYYLQSDGEYRELIEGLNRLSPDTLEPDARIEYFFIYLVTQERKPHLVSGKRTFDNYLDSLKDYMENEKATEILIDNISYCHNNRLKDLSERLQQRVIAADISEKEKLYYSLAERAFKDSNYEMASKFFDEYLKEIAQRLDYKNYIREVVKIKDLFKGSNSSYYPEMFELYEISLKIENEPALKEKMIDKLNKMALYYYKNGEDERALKLYKLLYHYKPDPQVVRVIADIYFQNREFLQAREYFMFIGNWREIPEVIFKVGFCYFRTAQPLESFEILNLIVQDYPSSEYCDDALYYLILMCQDSELFSERDKFLSALKENFPTSEYIGKSSELENLPRSY